MIFHRGPVFSTKTQEITINRTPGKCALSTTLHNTHNYELQTLNGTFSSTTTATYTHT